MLRKIRKASLVSVIASALFIAGMLGASPVSAHSMKIVPQDGKYCGHTEQVAGATENIGGATELAVTVYAQYTYISSEGQYYYCGHMYANAYLSSPYYSGTLGIKLYHNNGALAAQNSVYAPAYQNASVNTAVVVVTDCGYATATFGGNSITSSPKPVCP